MDKPETKPLPKEQRLNMRLDPLFRGDLELIARKMGMRYTQVLHWLARREAQAIIEGRPIER